MSEVQGIQAGPSRKQQILELFEQGMTRRQIADALGLSYQAVYSHTKGGGRSGRGAGRIMLDNGMSRVDYIRQEYMNGRTRSEIAKELGVAYQVVFAATKAIAADVAALNSADVEEEYDEDEKEFEEYSDEADE